MALGTGGAARRNEGAAAADAFGGRLGRSRRPAMRAAWTPVRRSVTAVALLALLGGPPPPSPGQQREPAVLASQSSDPVQLTWRFDPRPGGAAVEAAGGLPLLAALSCPVERCSVTVQLPPVVAGCLVAHLGLDLGLVGTDRLLRLVSEVRGCANDGSGGAGDVAVVVVPTSVEFGQAVLNGGTRSRQVAVVSAGTAPARVTRLSVMGPGFRLPDQSCVRALPPGTSCAVTVLFDPRQAGEAVGALLVWTSAADPIRADLRAVVPGPDRSSVPPPPPPRQRPPPPATTALPEETRPESGPAVEARPGVAPPGSQVRVTGRDFQGPVRLHWGGPGGPLLATVHAGLHGTFSVDVGVPAAAALGPHRLVACDAATGCADATIVVASGDEPSAAGALTTGTALLLLVAGGHLWRRLFGDGGRDPGGRVGAGGGASWSRDRRVHTGFATRRNATIPLPVTLPLVAGRGYHFWIELGPPVRPDSPWVEPLTVVLYPYEGELGLVASLGEWSVLGSGTIKVTRQGGLHSRARGSREVLAHRLVFAVDTPASPGVHRLRASIYHAGLLVQSWVVTVAVRPAGPVAAVRARMAARSGRPVLISERDFALVRTLDPGHLTRLAPHRLSLMLNEDGPDRHSFRVLGDDGFHGSASIGAGELGVLGAKLREVLEEIVADRRGDGPPSYRYATPDPDRLAADLCRLARWGYRAYADLVHRLARDAPGEGRRASDRLADLLRRPGRIQVANRLGATAVVPAAFLYDHPLDTDLPTLEICPAFAEARRTGRDLGTTPCFEGECPSHRRRDVVCPSGFWGFRHVIGMPHALEEGESGPVDVPLVAGLGACPVPVAVYRDPGFRELPGHLDRLRAGCAGVEWEVLESRQRVLDHLGTCQPPMVYLYCHGGRDGGVAYLQLGQPGDPLVTGDALLAYDVVWDVSHPLVFLNGCQTGAIGPETPMELVGAFVQHAQAVGVIGTEVTLFEPLACRFAEELLRLLLVERRDVGTAVRAARLSLLAEGNPLGLVYIPFVADEVVVEAGVGPAHLPAGAGGSMRR